MCSLFLVLCSQGAANLLIAKDDVSSHAPSPVGWFTWMFPAFVVSYVVNNDVGGHWIRVTKKKIIIIYNYFSYSLPTPFRCDGTKLDSVPYTNGRVAPLLDCCWSNEGSRGTAAVMVDDREVLLVYNDDGFDRRPLVPMEVVRRKKWFYWHGRCMCFVCEFHAS